MKPITIILGLLLAAHAVAGPSTRSAKAKHDRAVEAAERAYKDALVEAKRAYLTDLRVALKGAMAAGKLDEANQIKAQVDDTQAELDALMGLPTPGAAHLPMQGRGRWVALKPGAKLFGSLPDRIHAVPPGTAGKVFWQADKPGILDVTVQADLRAFLITPERHKVIRAQLARERWEAASTVDFPLRHEADKALIYRKDLKKGQRVVISRPWVLVVAEPKK